MSWGERSCMLYGKCTKKATMSTCNVDCEDYYSNGKEPDSQSRTAFLEELMRSFPNTTSAKAKEHNQDER